MHFFLSYAQDDDLDGSVQDFFRDLSREVADLAGCRPEEAGYIDGQLPLGSDRAHELARALNSAACFVAMTSPRFVANEDCGREFAMFARRVDLHAQKHNVHPPALIPVRWIPSIDLPAAITRFQYRNAATDAVYAKDGLRALRRRKVYADVAGEFVQTLARHIVQTGRDHQLHRLAPGLGPQHMHNEFAEPGGALPESSQDPSATSARHVHVVIAAGNRDDMAAVRPEALEPYGPGADRWRPYHPELQAPIGSYTGAVVGSIGYQWSVRDATKLPAVLRWAKQHNQIVVLVVDVWSAEIPRYVITLMDYDSEPHPSAPLLVPWTVTDERIAPDGNQKLWDVLARILPHQIAANDTAVFRAGLPTWSHFKADLRSALVEAQSRIFRTGQVDPPTDEPSGPPPVLETP
ncbi:TIR-like protein FxsC [Dactylosporangium sp. NPDC000521]|uniref:TIR-like protein FxsC n=1 Tax=Dactylosporangium sp. NPDC000521 TaxID=3363975 RepID=UPI0036B40D89